LTFEDWKLSYLRQLRLYHRMLLATEQGGWLFLESKFTLKEQANQALLSAKQRQ
jgi:hypothetical protein